MTSHRSASNRRFFCYALGGGRGHVTRIASLATELNALGADVLVALPAGMGRLASAFGLGNWLEIAETEANELRQQLERTLRTYAPSDCIIDTFPEGLLGELAAVEKCGARWMSLLRLRRDAKEARVQNALRDYAACFDLEAHLDWLPAGYLPRVERFGPVARELTAEPDQYHAREVLLVSSEASHHDYLLRLRDRLAEQNIVTRLVSTAPGDLPFTMQHLNSHVVVGPAGYNLTYELMRAGAWHIALPVSRLYDDQRRRATACAIVCASPQAVERRLFSLLQHAERRASSVQVRPVRALAERLLEE